MNILSPSTQFEHLLQAATAQPEPQRLLFVFATAELPDDATPAQRESFQSGGGGALAPLMCVDKSLDELKDFPTLVAESRRAGPPWQVMFVAALSGRKGQPPSEAQVEQAMQKLVERVRGGMIDGLLAFDPAGDPLQFA